MYEFTINLIITPESPMTEEQTRQELTTAMKLAAETIESEIGASVDCEIQQQEAT